MQHAVECHASYEQRYDATQLTLFALLFVFELADMEMREGAPLGVTSEQQPASPIPNANEDLALSVKVELISHRGHGEKWQAPLVCCLGAGASWGYSTSCFLTVQ